jgi:putative endonuclease
VIKPFKQLEGFLHLIETIMNVYILFSPLLQSYYTGFCNTSVAERLEKHNSGFYKGSYTSKADDWLLQLVIECDSTKQALQIEKHIKKMKSKIYIKNLLQYPEMIEKLKLKYV